MDLFAPKPIKLPYEYYKKNFYLKSREAFLEQAKGKCEGSEDMAVCIQKLEKSFDIVFESLKDQLEKEDKVLYQWKLREYHREGYRAMELLHFPSGTFY